MIYWLVSIAALVGVVLNIRKHVACFYVWAVTNAAWAWIDPIRRGWEDQRQRPKPYTAGSWGPSDATALMARDDVRQAYTGVV